MLEFIDACRAIKIDLLAIDEAHCISHWGQDFRPSYLKIADFVDALGYRPTMAAFTATATAEVKDDIEYSLKLKNPFRITTGFDRPNLRFEVRRPKKKFEELLRLLKRYDDSSGIVYCSTRKAVEEVACKLQKEGLSVTMYHAGLEDGVRKENQEDFVYDRKSIMVATNAFGMGIDKSNVSYVIHYNMPLDVESYYQEAGRAGRDGSRADCILIYNPRDVITNQYLIEASEQTPEISYEEFELMKARDYERLKQMTFYSTTNNCLRSFILDYFGERSSGYCGNCSNCLTQFQDVDITVDAQKILSCIKRTGQRFGKKMICDILKGSKNERLIGLGLNNQTTYGLMADYKLYHIMELISFLEQEGYVETFGNNYPMLGLLPRASDVLFGGERITMKQAKPKEPKLRKTKKTRAASSAEAVDRTLLLRLKALRREIADGKNVPAYIVFSDATLIDMCRKLPKNTEEMLDVSGVGETKLKMYGESFLHVLREYYKVHYEENE